MTTARLEENLRDLKDVVHGHSIHLLESQDICNHFFWLSSPEVFKLHTGTQGAVRFWSSVIIRPMAKESVSGTRLLKV